MSVDNLGDRMKLYESVPRSSLMPKVPVMIRMDGKAFHTLTSGLQKPYDIKLQQCMWNAALHLCKSIQGARVAYVQSDEITVFVSDYQSREAMGWFGYDTLKMTSVSASLCTGAFNKEFASAFPDSDAIPAFDSRVWSLPIHEVVNAFIWRQNDAIRNSINALGQAHFSHRQLHGKSTSQVKELLLTEKKINWDDCPADQKHGVCVVKQRKRVTGINPKTQEAVVQDRTEWGIDKEIPLFAKDRAYIQHLVDPPGYDD